jgi:hypothetical protein
MEKLILWDENINEQFVKVSEKQLDLFMQLLSYIDDNNISNKLCIDLCDNSDLWQWLGSKKQIGLCDIKKELSIKINKAKKICGDEYRSILCNVGKSDKEKLLVLNFDNISVFYISTMDEYLVGLRSYLAMEKKDDFCRDMLECFPNIYFVEDIASTFNSLNRDFEELREEIVEHLTKINDYHANFVDLLSQNKNNQAISQKFYADTGIECAPQAGREGIQALTISCYNEKSKQVESVKCELHTKFKKFNTDRTKQDRIYFFPGKSGIKDGKIIVKHIGKHL